MDFRAEHCLWCPAKAEPVQGCASCPRYRRYFLHLVVEFTAEAFCSMCIHNGGGELEVFCRTNRALQAGSPEDFDCYKFSPARPRLL
ncbi:MAG TPA: hypothetical protein PLS81_03945 [Deltaproteobacteria bacterium]|nr:hypothetical protein [Deltaproteobacteria bacterium]HOM28594.1 hypothetical protein [Deltaproteobacteria bacterium]